MSNRNLVHDLSTGSITVSERPALLVGVFVSKTMSAHDLLIKDDTVTKKTVPASSVAGSQFDGCLVRYGTNLIIEPNASAAGEVEVIYRYADTNVA